MKTRFSPAQFTPTQWSTAEDKAKFASHYLRFVESDFAKSLFHDWFYRRLSQTFGHIAHFNRAGFYETFFTTTEGKLRFLEITVTHPPYGDPASTYCDVERVLAAHVKLSGLRERYERERDREIETRERAELARLRAKYETVS